MDTGDEDRRWYEEIERRLTLRFRAVYIALFFAGACGFCVAYSQRMVHDGELLPASATIVALGTGTGGEPTMTSTFVDAEGNWHRDTQPTSYYYRRGTPQVGEQLDYLYGIKPVTGEFYAVPRADGMIKWIFGVPAVLLGLLGVVLGALVMREHNARRALVRDGERLPLELPRIGRKSFAVPTGSAGMASGELWRLEGRVFDASVSAYVECASDWQQPPPPPELDLASVPPLLVDPARPKRRWLPVGALRTAGYAPRARKAA